MIITNISFSDKLANPILFSKQAITSPAHGYYSIENSLTGCNAILYVYPIHQPNNIPPSNKLLLPSVFEHVLFGDSSNSQDRFLKIRRVDPVDSNIYLM